jgi:serine/threonine-protein kinase
MTDSGMAPTEMVELPRDPLIGAVIGERYRILARIGEGGMGAVFRAEHTLMKKVVALKLLHAEMGQVEDAARRFEREAQSASRLNHPSIISVTDFGRSTGGELFLVMEFAAGESLADVIAREGHLELGRACRIASQLLGALEHAHAQGVVHRDLKPANVMLVQSPDPRQGEVVKILDFGIAKILQASDGAEPLTRGVMVFGTPAYMAPEQAMGQDVDARADLYSFGIMLYEMLTGKKPFESDDLVKLMSMQVTAPPPSFASVAPEISIPGPIEDVVMRALEKMRDSRWSSAAEFRDALEKAETGVAELGARVAAESVRVMISSGHAIWSRRSRAWAVLCGLGRGLLAVARALRAALNWILGRLPEGARLWVKLALVAATALTFVLVVRSARQGAAPRQVPPAPKPVAQEVRSPIRHIEDAMTKAHFAEARVLIMQQISVHPKEARLRYLLGNLEFAEKNPSAALTAYDEALRLDPGLRGDAALLINLRGLLTDRRLGEPALEMLADKVGLPAAETLAEIASEDRRLEFRQTARTACETLHCAKVDLVRSYSLDLQQAKTCEEKRTAVQKLGATKDERAVEPLQKARRNRGGIFGGLFGSGNTCIAKDIDAALRELGVDPNPAKKKGKR